MSGNSDEIGSGGDVLAAQRVRRPGWRDPRILGGVSVMAVCVLLGGWSLRSLDRDTTALVVDHDVVAGATLGSADVTARRVHLGGDLAGDYYTSAAQLPDDAHVAHDLGEGELVPRSALEADDDARRVEVPLAVAPEDLPSTVRPGASVDVWVLPDRTGGAGPGKARRVLTGVPVLKVSEPGTSLSPQETRQVIVTLPGGSARRLAAALAGIANGRVLLTRKG